MNHTDHISLKKTPRTGNLLRESNLFLAYPQIHAAWDWVSNVPRIGTHCILVYLVLVWASLERCENEIWLCWKLTGLLWSSRKFSSGFKEQLAVWHERDYSSSQQDVNTLRKHYSSLGDLWPAAWALILAPSLLEVPWDLVRRTGSKYVFCSLF